MSDDSDVLQIVIEVKLRNYFVFGKQGIKSRHAEK